MAAASEGEGALAAARNGGGGGAEPSDTERALAAAGARAVLLLRFAESLASAGGVDEVCRTIVEQCRSGLGAAGAAVALYDPADQVLSTVHGEGYPPDAAAVWRRMPIDAVTPITVAVRERRPVFFADPQEWVEEFPGVPLIQSDYAARSALPMFDPAVAEPLGAIVLSWVEPHGFDDAERTLLRTVAALCAQSLSRALAREQQERELFASAVDAMLDPVAIYSAVRDDTGAIRDFRIEYVNAATVTPVGARADEMVGRTLRNLFPYLERTTRLEQYARVVETREPLLLEGVRVGTPGVDEQVFDIQVAAFQDGIIIATRDVTERHRTEAELVLSEDRLNAAQRVGRIGSWESDEQGTTVWSDELYRMFGVPDGQPRPEPDEVLKRTIALGERLRLRALVADMWSTRHPLSTEYPVVTLGGERRWFSARAEIQDAGGAPVLRGVVQDITEQRALERALSTLTADLRDERAAAEVLQRALLPQALPEPDRVRVHAVYEPAGHGTHAGGDWYDAFELPGGRLAFTVGDVAGHGLAAAATMSELRHAIRAFASLESSPGELVTRLSRMFAAWSREPYATCAYGVLDPARRRIEFANAGHLPLLVRDSNGASFVESRPGPPLGAAPYEYPTLTVDVLPGELYLLYTDGLVERRDEGIDVSLHRLERTVVALAGLPARDVCERLVAGAREAPSDGPDDDVCVLAVEVLG